MAEPIITPEYVYSSGAALQQARTASVKLKLFLAVRANYYLFIYCSIFVLFQLKFPVQRANLLFLLPVVYMHPLTLHTGAMSGGIMRCMGRPFCACVKYVKYFDVINSKI